MAAAGRGLEEALVPASVRWGPHYLGADGKVVRAVDVPHLCLVVGTEEGKDAASGDKGTVIPLRGLSEARVMAVLRRLGWGSARVRDAMVGRGILARASGWFHPTGEEEYHARWVERLMPLLETVERRLQAEPGSVQARWQAIIIEIDTFERWVWRQKLPWFSESSEFQVPFMAMVATLMHLSLMGDHGQVQLQTVRDSLVRVDVLDSESGLEPGTWKRDRSLGGSRAAGREAGGGGGGGRGSGNKRQKGRWASQGGGAAMGAPGAAPPPPGVPPGMGGGRAGQ